MHGCRPGALPFLYFQTQAANNLVAEIASTATQLDIVLRFQRRPRPSPARSGAGGLAKHGVMLKDGGRISRALLVSAADLQQAHTKAARARLPGLGPSKRKRSIAAHVMAGFDQGWEYMGVYPKDASASPIFIFTNVAQGSGFQRNSSSDSRFWASNEASLFLAMNQK